MNTTTIDIDAMRSSFPALGAPTVRLDGPAGSQIPQQVIDAIVGHLTGANANLGGPFPQSIAATDLYERARLRTAGFFGTDDAGEVGFGLNASAVNIALVDAAAATFRPGDEIVLTVLDHQANTEPWHRAAARHGLTVRTVGLDADGRLDMHALRGAVGARTRVVAFPYANNATGTAVDVAAVAKIAHSAGALAWADPTHYAPHGPMAVRDLGADVAFCSAYKFFGPHLGLFYANRDLLNTWTGGDATALEHGTPPLESLAGLVAAFDYLDKIGWDLIVGQERALGERLLAGLPAPWRLHGPATMDGRTATFALTLPGSEPADLAADLAERGFAVGAGRFHAPAVFDALGLDSAIRIGLLHYNTAAEVDAVLAALAATADGR
jgi:cysteine desulfurase family protein (TIGR01976 family)